MVNPESSKPKHSKAELLKLMVYPEDSQVAVLQLRLGELAAIWRGTHRSDTPTELAIQIEYYQVMKEMLELGWEGDLDVDAELPSRIMPREYFLLRPDVLEGSEYSLGELLLLEALIFSSLKFKK